MTTRTDAMAPSLKLPPVTKTVTVDWPPAAAFRHFTDEIAAWWPLRSHSVGGERAQSVIFEGRVGGRIYETIAGGEESTWGTVTGWDPPRRVAFTWHPGHSPSIAQEIEVRFEPVGTGTRLELTHSGWERLGKLAARARRGYSLGWGYVLQLWAGRKDTLSVKSTEFLIWLLGPLLRRMDRKARAMLDQAARR